MAGPEENGLVKAVENFLAEKEAIAAKEKKLVDDLNAVLGKMGYRIIPAKTVDAAETTRKRGRPPGLGKGSSPKTAAAS